MCRFNRFLILTILSVSASLFSCVSSRVDSNKRSDFTQQEKRIFITGKGTAGAKDYMKWFSKSLLEGLKAKGVDCVFYYYDPLALETDEEVLKMINDYHPDAVLNIQQSEATVTATGWVGSRQSEAIFVAQMFIPNQKNPVWKAQMGVASDIDLSLAGKQSAKRLIIQLKKDAIIL
jgi:hypothetical protein